MRSICQICDSRGAEKSTFLRANILFAAHTEDLLTTYLEKLRDNSNRQRAVTHLSRMPCANYLVKIVVNLEKCSSGREINL